MAWFAVTSIGQIAHALRNYRKETLRLIAQIGMGTGAMAVVGGTVAIVGFVTLSGSSLVAIQGFASLGNIGVEAFTGFFAALINVRIAAPVVTGIALAATVGAGATAELGAMRISEEIDALEVMGIKSISFLVSTRIMAGLVVIIPLYAMAMIMSFLSPQITTTLLYGQSSGTYEHYFRTFLRPDDVFWSFVEAIIISVIVMITHCYYGYNASGGPVGVGEAVGRSMRFSLVSVQVVVSVRRVGALRRQPELRPDGVAAMTAPGKTNEARTPPYKTGGRRACWSSSPLASCWCTCSSAGTSPPKTQVDHAGSTRAGLVMDPGSKVTYNGVEIGRVASISEVERDGKPAAKFILDVYPKYLILIPANVDANIKATTVFGGKYVSFTSPNKAQHRNSITRRRDRRDRR